MQAVGIRECLDALVPHWETETTAAESFNLSSDTIKRSVGVASYWYGLGNTSLPNPSTIRLGITAKGELKLHQGAVDIGRGSNTLIPQICADAFGILIDQFELVSAVAALTPDCGKTSASRHTFVAGKAAELAGTTFVRRFFG